MDFKKQFSRKELDEVETWFKERMDKMPESLELSKSTKIADFKKTLDFYLELSHLHAENPTYSGQIYHLFLMRDKIIELYPDLA